MEVVRGDSHINRSLRFAWLARWAREVKLPANSEEVENEEPLASCFSSYVNELDSRFRKASLSIKISAARPLAEDSETW